MSPEEQEELNRAVALSGLPKQEYCYRRCMNRDVVVQGNPRVFKALRNQLAAVIDELKRIAPKIDLKKICAIIDDTPYITDLQKAFYKTMLTERKEKIIDFAFQKLRRRERTMEQER